MPVNSPAIAADNYEIAARDLRHAADQFDRCSTAIRAQRLSIAEESMMEAIHAMDRAMEKIGTLEIDATPTGAA